MARSYQGREIPHTSNITLVSLAMFFNETSLNNHHLLFPSTANTQAPKGVRFRRTPLESLGPEQGNTQTSIDAFFQRIPLEPLKSEREMLKYPTFSSTTPRTTRILREQEHFSSGLQASCE
ncbi:hypothetical protein CR513_23136, partial [Mucuna pruriens]